MQVYLALLVLASALYAAQQRLLSLLAAAVVVAELPERRAREWWVAPRAGDYWDGLLRRAVLLPQDLMQGEEPLPNARQECWSKLRMSPECFRLLCAELRPVLARDPLVQVIRGEILSVERMVAAVLYRLAHDDSLASVSNLFGMAPSTASGLVVEVCQAINLVLLRRLICLPEGTAVREVMAGFQARSGLPNCIGAVDGTHIPLDQRPPQDMGPGDYFCERKNIYSIVMQAVVDSSMRFLDIDVRWPGRCHDAFIFRESQFFQGFPTKYGEFGIRVGGVYVPPYVVADSAYPLSPWCIKRYVAGRRGGPNDRFDGCVQSARIVVENAFARLKGRWRVLRSLAVSLEAAPTVISACAVLHNFIELFDAAPAPVVEVAEPEEVVNLAGEAEGVGAVRDALRDYIQGAQ